MCPETSEPTPTLKAIRPASGTLAGTDALEGDLAREEADIEDELDVLAFYPAITIGGNLSVLSD